MKHDFHYHYRILSEKRARERALRDRNRPSNGRYKLSREPRLTERELREALGQMRALEVKGLPF